MGLETGRTNGRRFVQTCGRVMLTLFFIFVIVTLLIVYFEQRPFLPGEESEDFSVWTFVYSAVASLVIWIVLKLTKLI